MQNAAANLFIPENFFVSAQQGWMKVNRAFKDHLNLEVHVSKQTFPIATLSEHDSFFGGTEQYAICAAFEISF
jgi:hypothetical protein